MSEPRKSALVEALEARAAKRDIEFIDAAKFCSPSSKFSGRVAFRVAFKLEEMMAAEQAEQHARKAGGESPMVDRAWNIDNKTLHILWQVTRNGTDEETARTFPAFDSTRDMARLLSGDEIARLLNEYNAFALKHSPNETRIDTETVDGYVATLAALAGSEAASAILARVDRVWLEQFVQIVCVRLRDAGAELEAKNAPHVFVPLDEPEGPMTLADEAGVR